MKQVKGDQIVDYAKPQVLVEPEWVQATLGDPRVRLVEVDVDTAAYAGGHILGAVALNWTTKLQDQIQRDVASQEILEGLLGQAGIRPEDTVVAYGDNNNWFAGYFCWVMKMYGHDDIRIMNGGCKKWLQDNRPMTKKVPVYPPSQYRTQPRNESIRAYRHDVLELLTSFGRGVAALVDVRSPREFTGEIMAPPGLPETAQRGGHIPGAVNIPGVQAVRDDGSFKSAEELQALYGSKGVTPDRDVVAYCR